MNEPEPFLSTGEFQELLDNSRSAQNRLFRRLLSFSRTPNLGDENTVGVIEQMDQLVRLTTIVNALARMALIGTGVQLEGEKPPTIQ